MREVDISSNGSLRNRKNENSMEGIDTEKVQEKPKTWKLLNWDQIPKWQQYVTLQLHLVELRLNAFVGTTSTSLEDIDLSLDRSRTLLEV